MNALYLSKLAWDFCHQNPTKDELTAFIEQTKKKIVELATEQGVHEYSMPSKFIQFPKEARARIMDHFRHLEFQVDGDAEGLDRRCTISWPQIRD